MRKYKKLLCRPCRSTARSAPSSAHAQGAVGGQGPSFKLHRSRTQSPLPCYFTSHSHLVMQSSVRAAVCSSAGKLLQAAMALYLDPVLAGVARQHGGELSSPAFSMASTCSGLATWLTGMLRLPRLACAAAWNSIWQLALLFRTQPAGRVMAAADRWHRVLHATRRGSRFQSSGALLEAHLYVAPSDIASWAIAASPRDDDHGQGRPPGERTRAVRFVWHARVKAQA